MLSEIFLIKSAYKRLYVSVLLFCVWLVCPANTTLQITGTLRNADKGTIVYRKSMAGMFNSFVRDTLLIEPDSTFSLTLPVHGYERIDFVCPGKAVLGGVISNGGKVHLDINVSAKNHMSVSGPEENVIQLTQILNQLDADVWDLRARRGDRWLIAKDTVASSVSRKLKMYADSLYAQLSGLDEELYEKARQDIRMQLLLAFQNQTMATYHRASDITRQSWFSELEQMTRLCNINHPGSTFSPAFYDVVANEAGIRYYMRKEKLPEHINKGPELFSYSYEQTLDGNAQETAMALLILEDQDRENYNPNILPIAERFFRNYPESNWRPWVEMAVDKNKKFNQVVLPEDIHFPDVSAVKSLKEIIDLYKGKVVFMDIWATWCGPCRESFAYVKPLQAYAKENDIVLLYLSIDKPSEESKWKKMAAYYDLKGEHVLMQEAFRQEIYDTFGNKGALYIPRCVIFGKDGDVRYKVAASPEKIDELKKQLETARE